MPELSPQVAEHHLADVDGGPERVGDVARPPVDACPRRVPAAEDRADRKPELLAGILRERVPGALAVDLLELADDGGQRVRVEVDVGSDAALALRAREDVLEQVRLDTLDDVPEHLQEPPVGVEREPPVAARLRQAIDGLVVQSEVEDRVHHPRHRHDGAGAHGDQQGRARIAEPEADALLERLERLVDLVGQSLGPATARLRGLDARLGRDREAVRHGDPEREHLGKPGALAAEQPPHVGRSLGERVDVAHRPGTYPAVTANAARRPARRRAGRPPRRRGS